MRQPRAWAHFCTLLSLLICVAENYSHLHFLEARLEWMDGPRAKGWKGCQPHTLFCDFWGVLRDEGTQREAVSWPAERASLMCRGAGTRRVQRKTLSISFVSYNRLSWRFGEKRMRTPTVAFKCIFLQDNSPLLPWLSSSQIYKLSENTVTVAGQ